MADLINADQYPETEHLFEAVQEQFDKGSQLVSVSRHSKIIGAFVSPEAAHQAIARKVAEQWLAHPEIVDELVNSIDETPEDWD